MCYTLSGDIMNYLIKNTTKEEREKLVYKALGISLTGADKPTDKALYLANLYIEGKKELTEIQELIVKEYQK